MSLGLFVLYDSFPRLKAELRGCVYYWQRLTAVTVLLVRRTLSSSSWCLRVSKEINTPSISSDQRKKVVAGLVAATSDQSSTYNTKLAVYTMTWYSTFRQEGKEGGGRGTQVLFHGYLCCTTCFHRTKRLHLLLKASNSRHCITRTYLIQQ